MFEITHACEVGEQVAAAGIFHDEEDFIDGLKVSPETHDERMFRSPEDAEFGSVRCIVVPLASALQRKHDLTCFSWLRYSKCSEMIIIKKAIRTLSKIRTLLRRILTAYSCADAFSRQRKTFPKLPCPSFRTMTRSSGLFPVKHFSRMSFPSAESRVCPQVDSSRKGRSILSIMKHRSQATRRLAILKIELRGVALDSEP